MGKYWLKIGLKALVIFLAGLSVVYAARRAKSTIHSSRDISIPLGALGAYLPFKLDGSKVGNLRSLVIQRSTNRRVSGFIVKATVSDSATFERLKECRFSVTDLDHFDDRMTFFCLKADSGYQTFGEVRIEQRLPDATRALILPLLLPDATVRDFSHDDPDFENDSRVDSLARDVQGRVRTQGRAYRDSVRAVELEEEAKRIQRKADSLRAKSLQATPPAPKKP